jgi:Uma2 family endonuclease
LVRSKGVAIQNYPQVEQWIIEGATRATITLDMPPPRLVVEVVSPEKKNIDRNYCYKRSQYEVRGIVEYWIVDPIATAGFYADPNRGAVRGGTV